MINEERGASATGQTVSAEYRRWVFSRMPRMAALLDILDAGGSPNFLDIMGGLSDIVAFTTEGDPNLVDPPEKIFSMSGKLCRFCC